MRADADHPVVRTGVTDNVFGTNKQDYVQKTNGILFHKPHQPREVAYRVQNTKDGCEE